MRKVAFGIFLGCGEQDTPWPLLVCTVMVPLPGHRGQYLLVAEQGLCGLGATAGIRAFPGEADPWSQTVVLRTGMLQIKAPGYLRNGRFPSLLED